MKRGYHALGAVGDSASAAAPGAIPIFYFDQDETTQPCGMQSKSELRAMRNRGEGKFENHGKSFRLFASTPERRRPLSRFTPSRSAESTASISLSEVLANVGIAGETRDWRESVPAPRHIVQRAKEKIRAIARIAPGSVDDKAVLACVRHWTAAPVPAVSAAAV